MASSTSRLSAATPSLSIESQANIARALIAANELYKISNSTEYSEHERHQALAESSSMVKNILKELPSDPSALNLMARIELDQSEHEHAEALLLKALEISPSDENTLLNYAYLLIAKRQYAEAESCFLRILEQTPGSHRAFSGIALSKLRQKDYLAAFNHYKRLIELGYDSTLTRLYFLDSVEFLRADVYDQETEALLLKAFSWENIEHTKLANMVTGIISAKYDLSNPQAIIDLDQLMDDKLLIASLDKCLLPSIDVEFLLTEMRRSIMTEISLTQNLRDSLLPAAIAIGQYSANNDYVLMMSQDEENEVSRLVDKLKASTLGSWTQDDLIGALITLSMYEPLYTQTFSYQLLKYDVSEWPSAIQPLLSANLYELSNEHMAQFDLFGASANSLMNNEIRRANPRWTQLSNLHRSNLYKALCNELDESTVPPRFAQDKLKVLVLGCGSGQRALYLSRYFENIEVYGVDNSRENVAYASLKAKQLGDTSVQFIHAEYDTALITEHQFDIIEFGDIVNHVASPQEVIEEWQLVLADDGLLRFSFDSSKVKQTAGVITQLVKDRRLSPTADNIRHLRNAIMKEAGSGLWDKLFSDERFYSGSGCRDLFFNKHNHYFDLEKLDTLLNASGLSFIGFVDLDATDKRQSNPLAPYSLLAWHVIDQDNALFPEAYQLYCRKQ